MQLLHNNQEIQGIETVEFTKWTTPCAKDCPGYNLQPYYHTPHNPLYPILCAKCTTEEAV